METRRIVVGQGDAARDIAVAQRSGAHPGLFWLGGFKSEMTGTKAAALDALGAEMGVGVTRFDYSGHGLSGGSFLDGTISRWLEEALAVFGLTTGPQIVVGSSMGGWMALLLNRALREAGGSRVKALALVAPAIDMTEDLMRATFTPAELHDLHATGRVERPSAYSDEPHVLTERLIVDGSRHVLFGHGSIVVGCPVAILQGGQDAAVPLTHALKLLSHLTLDPVSFTLVPDGDHRLSRPEDLERLKETVRRLVAE
ncbi:MAG: alpha/beta fold hydrolase [Alphaproteobacteria bacterium]|nr:alpha/beta fold hydrolase [Alphaproteobacteria bacterium]